MKERTMTENEGMRRDREQNLIKKTENRTLVSIHACNVGYTRRFFCLWFFFILSKSLERDEGVYPWRNPITLTLQNH